MLGLVLAAAAPPAAPADEPKKDETEKEKAARDKEAAHRAESVRKIGMAGELAVLGRQDKAPEMLIAAARILRTATPARQGREEPKVEGGEAGKQKLASLVETSDKLLDEARKMARDDKAVLELADRVAKLEGEREAIGGPRAWTHMPGDGVRLTWSVTFRPGVPACVTVNGDGYRRLRTIVRGPAGYYYDWTGFNADTSWVPSVWGPTTITVINLGPGPVNYTVYTN
jgi:hypothetical protein